MDLKLRGTLTETLEQIIIETFDTIDKIYQN